MQEDLVLWAQLLYDFRLTLEHKRRLVQHTGSATPLLGSAEAAQPGNKHPAHSGTMREKHERRLKRRASPSTTR
jgi:hypothetical protein